MNTNTPIGTQPEDPRYSYSVVQFILTILAIVGLVGLAGIIALFGLVSSIGVNNTIPGMEQSPLVTLFVFSGGLLASAVLLAPSAYYAFRRMRGQPLRQSPRLPMLFRPTWIILWLPVILLLGYWVSKTQSIAWFLLPILNVLAIGIPVLWLLSLAVLKLPLGSPQRIWGVFDSGLVLGPAIILILETMALVAFIVVGILAISNQPQFVNQINELLPKIQQGRITQDQLFKLILPWLTKPVVVLAALAFVGLIVPLIEEAIKPIGVWLLVGFDLSPAAGFAAGALSGAGYAFFESLALANSGGEWTAAVSARIATGVIHIFNTALMGWALTSAWRYRRYLNLGLTYMLVVLVHGSWNSLAVINAIDSSLKQANLPSPFRLVSWLGPIAPYLLGVMTVVWFALMIWMNRRLRPAKPAEADMAITEATPDSQADEPPQAML